MKKYIIHFFVVPICLAIGIFVEPNVRKVNTDSIVDFKMLNDGSFCMICSSQNEYKLRRISLDGSLVYDIKLDDKQDSYDCIYRKITVDNDLNSYIAKEIFSSSEGSEDYPRIFREELIKYGVNGEFLGTIATVTLAEEDEALYQPIISQVQVIEDNVKLICSKQNVLYILDVDKSGQEEPKEMGSFFLADYIDTNESWVSDAVVTSDNNIVYTDKRGFMYRIYSDGSIYKFTGLVSQDIVPAFLSADEENNIYFTDLKKENFYNIPVNSEDFKVVYNSDHILNNKESVKLSDVQVVLTASKGDYYGMIKTTSGTEYIQFGNKQNIISQITYSTSTRILTVIIISVIALLILSGLILLYKRLKKKPTLVMRIFFQFFLIFAVSSAVLIFFLMSLFLKVKVDTDSLNNEARIKYMLEVIDVDKLVSVDTLHQYGSNDYINLSDQVENSFSEVKTEDSQMNIYLVSGGQIYRTYRLSSKPKAEDLNLEFVDLPKVPIKYIMDTDTFEKYYDLLSNSSTNNSDSYRLKYNEKDKRWISVVMLAKDQRQNIVGMVESKFKLWDVTDEENTKLLLFMVILFVIFMGLLLLYLYFLLKSSLKPLNKIKNRIVEIEKGHYNKKLEIEGKNQLNDICDSINKMSENIYKRVSELVLINEEYTKYTPKEMFLLVSKDGITDISLSNKEIKNICVLRVNLTGNKTFFDIGMSSEEYFDVVHNDFNEIFKVIERNNGFIQLFDGLSLTAIFMKNGKDIIKASMEIRDSIKNEKILNAMKMSLYCEDMVVGVIGNNDRKNIAIISNISILMENFISKFIEFPNKCILTEDVFEVLEEDKKKNYRLIGLIKDKYKNRNVKIYEHFNSKEYKEIENFYSALDFYISGQFLNASKLFIETLCLNKKDKISMYYLKMCDEYANKKANGWEGLLM